MVLKKFAEINHQKSKIIYDAIDESNGFYKGHARSDSRSHMNVTFNLPTDLDGSIYTANSAALEIIGRRAADIAGRSIFSVFGDISEQIEMAKEEQLDLGQLPPI